MQKEFGYKNVMQVPRLEKVVINMGVGAAGQTGGDAKILDGAVNDLTAITGQKPVVTRAEKVYRELPASGRRARRHKSDAAWRPHV